MKREGRHMLFAANVDTKSYHPELTLSLTSRVSVVALSTAKDELRRKGLSGMFFKSHPAAFGF